MKIITIDLLSEQTGRQREKLPRVGQKQCNLMMPNKAARSAVQLTPTFYLR